MTLSRNIVLACLVLAVGACHKKKKKTSDPASADPETVEPEGSTETTPTFAFKGRVVKASGLLSTPTPNEAWAFSLIGGAVKVQSMASHQTAKIADDGSFSFDLSPASSLNLSSSVSDYVIALVDTTQAFGNQFVNLVGLPAADSASLDDDAAAEDNLLNLPVADAEGTIDAGNITPSADAVNVPGDGDTAQEAATTLGISKETATQFAATGTVLNSIKNLINNCQVGGDAACPEVQTTYQWNATAGAALGKFSDPKDWTYYGYSFIIGLHNMGYALKDVCQAGSPILLSFYPPEDIAGTTSSSSISVGPNAPVTNAGLVSLVTASGNEQCNSESNSSLAYMGASGQNSFNFIPFSGGSFTSPIPEGNWKLDVTGKATGTYYFDLASAAPIDSDGNVRVWMPAVRITTDTDTGYITKVEVKLYSYDAVAATWVEMTDTAGFIAAMGGLDATTGAGGFTVMFDDTGNAVGRLSEHVTLMPVDGTNIFAASAPFTNNWHMPLAQTAARPATGNYPTLRFSYSLRGTQINYQIDHLD